MSGAVSLNPHDPSWATFFQKERTALLTVAGASIARLEHVGSSAVPQLVSRPSIDILIGVPTRGTATQLRDVLTEVGYQCLGQTAGRIPRYVRIDEHRDVAYELHLVTIDEPEWCQYLTVRDHLLHYPDEVRRYGLLKELIAPWGHDLYRKAKLLFFCSILGGEDGSSLCL